MTTLDLRLPPRVQALIAKYGVSSTLRTFADTKNNAAGTVSRVTTNSTITAIAPVPVSSKLVNGDTIQITDSWSVVAGLDVIVVPHIGAHLLVNSQTYSITAVRASWTGAICAAYELVLRRA